MKKNELTLVNGNKLALNNVDLFRELSIIEKATRDGIKNIWNIAYSYANIVSGELWEDDFKNQKEFAEFVGIAQSTLSEYKKAIDFKENHPEIPDTLTVSKANILSKVDCYSLFEEWVIENYEGALPYQFGDKCLKNMIKEYEKTLEPEEVEEIEEVEEPELNEEDEAMSIMIGVTDEEGNKYLIPLAVINQYRI